MTMDAKASERTAMELYFAPFRPWDPTSRLDAGCGALFFRLEVPARARCPQGLAPSCVLTTKLLGRPGNHFLLDGPG